MFSYDRERACNSQPRRAKKKKRDSSIKQRRNERGGADSRKNIEPELGWKTRNNRDPWEGYRSFVRLKALCMLPVGVFSEQRTGAVTLNRSAGRIRGENSFCIDLRAAGNHKESESSSRADPPRKRQRTKEKEKERGPQLTCNGIELNGFG